MSTTESGMAVQQPFKHYLVLDFESTCQEGARIDPQEIIEFPCLLVRADDLVLLDQVAIIYVASFSSFLVSFETFLAFTILKMFSGLVPRVRKACWETPVDKILHRSHWDHSGYGTGALVKMINICYS